MSTLAWNRGIAGIGARNTNQAPSQVAGARFAPTLNPQTLTEPRSDISNPSMYGGEIPVHSIHWANYFDPVQMRKNPMAKAPSFLLPDTKRVMAAVADPSNTVSGNTHNGWLTLFQLIKGPMRNGSVNSSAYQ